MSERRRIAMAALSVQVLLLSGLVAAAEGQPPGGLRAWPLSPLQVPGATDPAPAGASAGLSLVGVRNGTFAAQLVVGDQKPIKGLKVEVSALKGPGAIPASAAQVRYALYDGMLAGYDVRPSFFDSLEEFPPAEVPAAKGGAVQPVWITVSVPADARPGDYSGQVTVSAEGAAPVAVPLGLKVFDWKLPEPQNFTAHLDMIQSPESVAMAYDVPLWSDAHLKLLDKTFALLAPLACKSVYITCIRRTHFGNEHAQVRWALGDDGELTPDYSVAEKYLDAATARLGKVPSVIFYCWEPPESGGHAGGTDYAVRLADRPILITVADPKTGELSAQSGPAWGTAESKAFWKKMTDGLGPVLKKRGLEGSMLFGLAGDWRPTKQAMDDISNGVKGARWAGHSHMKFSGDNNQLHGYDLGMAAILWGINMAPVDPAEGRAYGWSNPFNLLYFSRNEIYQLGSQVPLAVYRLEAERWIGAKPGYTKGTVLGVGARGLGRVGADFWQVLKDGRGRIRGNLAGRYPEAFWGQLNMNNGIPWMLGRGKNGPVPTMRSEAVREGIQDIEARIYLEKAWLDDGAKALLGEDLRGRVRTALDERIRMCVKTNGTGGKGAVPAIDWNKNSELLFGLAAEVAGKYGGREPAPNLKPETPKK
jgi:hypothetical protein